MSEYAERERPGLFAAGSPLRTVLLVLVAYVALGAVAGVVWEWLWTPPGQVVAQHQVFYDSYSSLRRVFTGTGLYVLVGAAASALLSLVVSLLARGRELLTLVLVVLGSAIAAAVMLKVGTALGPADPASIAHHTTARTPVHGQLTVEGKTLWGIKSPYLIWPMASLLVLALVFFAWPTSHLPHHGGGAADPSEAEAGGLTSTGPPSDPQQLVEQIRSARFTPTRIRPGYEMAAVDRLLDGAVGLLTSGASLGPLLDATLPTVRWREGYDMEQVRAFLARLRESADAMDARG